ncbi:transporter substrate-binding domain-containing protein [Pseudomonas sp. UBA2684]|uniref:transporter substrate-binding domain-containing protein n=1 Tax=Pseudomonas sp. UBA2684 TaxID=1947311 RepID=UPI000E992C79|nr:transporter substrate-binding domain-containing protein [Pseudomonas sp. UBA2684]HBX53949.1 hypothetical protein [Pseudomonas sp.]|tara:strand:+ start:913 stop:2142 length:1230 start_codon:yes stop_codon:yes gene_type:complete
MTRMTLATLLLISSLFAPCQAAQLGTIRLDTSQEEPYQILLDGQLSGLSIDVLDCIFQRLEQPHSIQLTSWKRAKQNVSTHIAEGFFSSAPDAESDAFAQLSAPLLIEKWYWYALDAQVLNRPPWDPQLRIGGVLGSNTLAWLETRGIHVQQKVPKLEQLIQLLQRGRIDLILADQSAMDSASRDLNLQRQLQQRFVRYTPLGVYFSRAFLTQHPGFIQDFNEQVQNCAPASSPLIALEQQYLKQLVQLHLRRWGGQEVLFKALREAARQPLSEAAIKRLDQQWMTEYLRRQQPFIDSVRQQPASVFLQGVHQQYQPLFNELFLTDSRGVTAGMSRATSDYWQGDEAKFNIARTLPAEQLLIESIAYDGSTQSFQAQISAPLHDPGDGSLLGVLTFGVNIEAAFGDSQP